MEKVQLAGKDITLCPYELKHVEPQVIAGRESVAEISPWMSWCHDKYSAEESRNWIESCMKEWEVGTAYQFAITDSREGSFLGGCGLNKINEIDKVANLGYWVRSSRVKQGIATTATTLLAQFGFRKLKLNRIEILGVCLSNGMLSVN